MKKKIKKPHKIKLHNIKSLEEYVVFCRYQFRKGNSDLAVEAMLTYPEYFAQYRDEVIIPEQEKALGVKLERAGGIGRYGFYKIVGDVTTEQLESQGFNDIRGKTSEEVTNELLFHDFLVNNEFYVWPAEDD